MSNPLKSISKILKHLATYKTSVINFVLAIIGCAFLIKGFMYFYEENVPAATLGAAAGVFLIFASFIERFDFIKAFGIEAKVRIIDEKIAQAEVIVSKIRALAELTSQSLIKSSSSGTFIDAIQLYQLGSSTRELLLSLDTPQDKMREILKPWRDRCLTDLISKMYYKHFGHRVRGHFWQDGFNQDQGALIAQHREVLKLQSPDEGYASLIYYFEEHPILNSDEKAEAVREIKEWSQEVEVLYNNYTLKTIEKWLSLSNLQVPHP
jgi:hypothetical protein